MFARRLKVVGALLAIGLLPVACVWRASPEPSTLVILVENLGFGSFSCAEAESGRHGLQTFCDEAVRFTHAYTPSLLSQATVASILVAKFPNEHGLRTNGSQNLSAKLETLAEKALARGFRTAFFSGGPPLFRRSGLGQGFETFDDNVPVSLKSFYRPASEVVNLFLGWQETDAARDRFLTFLFLSDLQFVDAPTVNELGELRESSYRSQLDELDESLERLVKEMKRRKIWDGTNVFLVGLQGYPAEPRQDEVSALNLFSESTRSTLMIKPARKVRDGPFNWKIDANVSLVDVGTTLLDLIGATVPKPSRESSTYSLTSALLGPQPNWPMDRLVLSESAWASWRGLSGIRVAARRGPYLFVFDENPQVFDTLTDNLESSPLPPNEPAAASLKVELAQELREQGYFPWRPITRVAIERMALGRELWRESGVTSELADRLRALGKRYPEDSIVRAWRAVAALRSDNWQELKAVATANRIWHFVAARNLGESVEHPSDPCLDFLKHSASERAERRLSKDCPVEELTDLLALASDATPEPIRSRAMETFMRVYTGRALATRIAEQNLAGGLRWDTDLLLQGPEAIDLILALPEFKKIRASVRTRLAAERRL